MADDTYSRGYRNDRHDRGGPSDSGPATDPLTELARLIGQADPFAPDRNRQPDPRQPDAYPQSADWHADPAQHGQQYDPQHYEGQNYEGQNYDAQPYAPPHYDGQQHNTQQYDAQHYEHGAQVDSYATGEPQHYADNTYGPADQYASHQNNGYPYPPAGQHEASYDNASYAEQPHHQEQQAYQEQPAYQHEPQAYHPDQHPYHQEQPAHGQEAYAHEQPAHFAHAADTAEQGEHVAPQAAHQPVPGYPAPPPFFGSDPNARPDEYYEDAPAPRRGWLVTAAALVGLAVIGTAGAFAYRAVFAGGETRIITREVAPNKITPAQANQDNGQNKTGDRMASAGPNEKLGPLPEQPITIPEPPRTVPPAIGPNPAMAAPAPAPAPAPVPAAPAGPNQATAPADTGGNAAPRRVRTEKINPQQQVGDVSGPRAAGPIRQVGPPPPVQPRTAPPDPNAPLSLAPNAPDPAPAPAPTPAPQPRVHTTAVAPAPPPVERSSGGGSGYYVQLSAHKSEDEAKSTFRGIQARHQNLLGGQQVTVRRKDLGSKGIFYGAQVGPFSREAAGKLCDDLKAAGQTCMIQRN